MRVRAFVIAAIVATLAASLGGCGDSQPEAVQKTGRYQGKPDTQPWDSPEWGGEQAKWERAIESRTWSQSEYTRAR
jgi:hypothetical protein